jgi:hypothetical protein
MVDRPQGRADEVPTPCPRTRRGEPAQKASDFPAATDPTPSPAAQAQINQDEAPTSGEEDVV